MTRGQKLSQIALRFPGQFPDSRLYNLDVRDENFWSLEAMRLQLIEEIYLAEVLWYATRASANDFEEFLDRKKDVLRILEGKRPITEEKAEANWEFLKAKGRG